MLLVTSLENENNYGILIYLYLKLTKVVVAILVLSIKFALVPFVMAYTDSAIFVATNNALYMSVLDYCSFSSINLLYLTFVHSRGCLLSLQRMSEFSRTIFSVVWNNLCYIDGCIFHKLFDVTNHCCNGD